MTPPFGLNVDDYLNMDFGLDDGTDPEDSSLVRPSDVDLYEHGVASPYQDKAMLLSSAQAKAEDNAMSYLMQALNKQADISPEQGIATALLAAIPTFGGYMIGKSVGSPDLPPGYFEAGGTRAAIGLDKIGDPAAEGGLAGAAAGAKSAQGYIGALEADKAQKNDIYQKMAAIESNRASRLETQANAYEKAGIDVQTDLAMLPIKEASQMRLQNNSAQNTMDRALELDRLRDDRERMTPEVLAATQKALGIPLDPNMTPSQLRAATAAIEAGRRQQGQDIRLSGENVVPPSAATKQKMDSVIATKMIGERYINQLSAIGSKDPSLLTRTIDSALPQTEIGKLKQDLSLFAVQLRNARESGVMTEQDFQRYSNYLTLSPLDTVESVLARMRELQSVTDLSARATLTAAKLGRENVTEYEKYFGISSSPTNSGMPSLPGGTQSTQQAQGTRTTSGSRPQRSQFSSLQDYVNAMTAYNNSLKGSR